MPDSHTFPVDVCYGTAQSQSVISLEVSPGTTVAEAINLSGLSKTYPAINESPINAGVFGKKVALDHPLKPHDQVEIYRPLLVDPKEARRLRAAAKLRCESQE